ncbi:hypothetical protein D7Z54_18440 [Salibacterium salarium]|uniref:Uncharacterized protein n=1 Tax=Salibacterium salarium TaxID=284579 RepID=A0A428N0T5_9BACI|nr:hypothetical protein [Salibacterium salarium]RSL31958.1 hypothetical protein D7Z54_18440 [Salibacterium salarium]
MSEQEQNENQEQPPELEEEFKEEFKEEAEEESEEEEGNEEKEEKEDEEEDEKPAELDVGKKLFTIGQQISYKGKACSVINEYERSICIEYNNYPFLNENEEDFPYHREIIRKGEAEEALE